MPGHTLRGVFPIVITTFQEDGSLDLDSQAKLVRHLLEQGAHGLGLFGNASEGYALTETERMQLLRLVRDAAGSNIPLVVSSGHSGTQAAVELGRTAEESGADALMVLPPSFMKTDADGLMYYFDSISKAVSIPIMAQDAPPRSYRHDAGRLYRAAWDARLRMWCTPKWEAAPTAPEDVTTRKRREGSRRLAD